MALLAINNVAVAVPMVEGANRIVSANDCPGGRFLSVGRAAKAELEEVMLEIFSVSLPVLVMVTVVSLESPSLKLPKLMFLVLS